jgi:uncharacterized membrane protein
MISLQAIYWLAGIYLAVLTVQGLRDASNPKRWGNGLFWGLLAAMFLVGERLPAEAVGVVVLVLAGLAGFGALGSGRHAQAEVADKQSEALRLGHRLFVPALLIPGLTLGMVLASKYSEWGKQLLAPEQTTVVALGVACALAVATACWLTRQTPFSAVQQSRRLVDAIGWAALLPLLLAALGSVFNATGVGEAVAEIVKAIIPVDSRIAVVLAYALGMAVFTMIMGNAFAAFPVMTAGIGLPLLVQMHGADAAAMAAIGMLSGYCGTLMTPMAANFNLVPVALLELDDPHAVIKAQLPTALVLLATNIVLMYFIIFRNAA